MSLFPPRPPSFFIFTLIHLASLHFQSYPATLRPKCHRAILFSALNNFMQTPSLHGNVSFCSWSHYETLQCYCCCLSSNGQDQQQLERVVTEKLSSFILSLMKEYFKLTEARIELEVCYGKDRKGNELFI